MTTDEALKAFVETCDREDATLDEMINAYKALEATIRYPLSCDYALKNASQIEKLDALISFYAKEQGRLFVKFVNLPTDETVKRAETLQEIKDSFKTMKMLLFISESDPNATQEKNPQRGAENAQSIKRTTKERH